MISLRLRDVERAVIRPRRCHCRQQETPAAAEVSRNLLGEAWPRSALCGSRPRWCS
jgi:hypothetical protein